MYKGELQINKKYVVGKVEKTLFSSFIEHMGRAVYGGIYDREYADTDENGFRKDVIEMVKELSVSLVRYPGGNFLSGYNWKEGIGDKSARRPKLNLAWRQLEPNEIGVDEFIKWSRLSGTEPMLAVNMGTGSIEEAAQFVEYCNSDKGGYWGTLRAENGHTEPYRVKYWCVGNEMDGDWQIGALTAEEYGRKANEAAKVMRYVDPEIKLIVCGSSAMEQATYPEWDRKVLELTYERMDYLSLHRYYDYDENRDLREFLAAPADLQKYITDVKAAADYVKAYKRSDKTMMFSLDEWNVWHRDSRGCGDWEVRAPLLENEYDMADALVDAGLLCTLVNNCDRVKIACLAQLVNVIAPILTEDGGRSFKQTIYYPFQAFAKYCAGKTALLAAADVPTYRSKKYGEVPGVYHSVCWDEEKDEYKVFLVNVTENETELRICADGAYKIVEGETLKAKDIHDKNSFDEPTKVIPSKDVRFVDDEVTLSGYSFTVLTLKK